MVLPPIISVDDHVVEPRDMFERWLPPKHRDRAPRVVRSSFERRAPGGGREELVPAASGPECDFWLFEDQWRAISVGHASIGFEPSRISKAGLSYDDIVPSATDPKLRLEAMDVVDVERSLCYPNVVRFCGQVFLWMDDKELALACVRAYNDWIVEEWCGDSGGRLLAVGLIPLWDPVAAAAEVRRNAARGVSAVSFSELPPLLGLPSIHDHGGHWRPLFDACDETGTTVCMHIGSSSTMAGTSEDAPNAVRQTLSMVNAEMALSDWLFSGHFVRYPNLKIALAESQIGWMPYVYERADRIWELGNAIAQVPDVFEQSPTEYAKGRVFGCFFADTFGIEVARDAIGVDTITFEMDFPHQDSTWPDTHDYAARVLAGVDDDTVHKVLRGNAIRMLGLPETLP